MLTAVTLSLRRGAAGALFALACLCYPPAASAATFTVNSTLDAADASAGNGTCATSSATGSVCTLRAALQEVNALGAAGSPHTINFNIAGVAAGSTARIDVPTALPAVNVAGTVIDATTQPDTNTGSLGTGGTVGAPGFTLTLSTVPRPDVEIVDTGGVRIGIDIQASGVTVRGLCIYGFGTQANADGHANIRLGAAASGSLIERNVLGSAANSFTDPGGTARSVGDNIRSQGADNGTVTNNLIGFSAGKGFGVEGGSSGWLIDNNEIRGNGITNAHLDGIDLETAGTILNTVRGNLIAANEGVGVDSYQSNGQNTIEHNTVELNGRGPTSPSGAGPETPGVRLYGSSNTVRHNLIRNNYGAGVLVTSASRLNLISQNSISGNGDVTGLAGAAPTRQIGIDLIADTGGNNERGTSPYVSTNDSGDGDAGGNDRLNFPVFTSAIISGTNLTLTGYARPGSAVELFVAAPDQSNFGEGQAYLTTLTEGSAADADNTSGAYTSPVNGLNVGADTTNRFKFTVTAPAGVTGGTPLTATATVGTNTSEFAGNITVALAPDLLLEKCVVSGARCLDLVQDLQALADVTYVIRFTNRPGTGRISASGLTVVDIIPPNTEFKVGSPAYDVGTTSLTAPPTVRYTTQSIPNPVPGEPPLPPPLGDNAAWSYTPTGAYDPAVTFIRWDFGGTVPAGTTGDVRFTVRIR